MSTENSIKKTNEKETTAAAAGAARATVTFSADAGESSNESCEEGEIVETQQSTKAQLDTYEKWNSKSNYSSFQYQSFQFQSASSSTSQSQSASASGFSYSFSNMYPSRSMSSQRILKKNRSWQYTDYGYEFKNLLENDIKNKAAPDVAPTSATTTTTTTTNSATNSNSSTDFNPFQFKFSSYNLLAPELLTQNMYLYDRINPLYLDWNYRKEKLYKEVKRLSSDIYCFQEMQENEYETYFMPKFKKLGYKCYFKKRYGNQKLDGCCIAFKSRKFRLLKQEPIDFYVPNVEVLNRENVGLILLLEIKHNTNKEKKICVATTHLLYNPKRGDCKLAQMQLLLAHLDRIAFKRLKIVNNKLIPVYYPTILCGDFNSSHDSKLYEFVYGSNLENYRNLNRNLISGQFTHSSSFVYIQNALLPADMGITDQSIFKTELESRLREYSALYKSQTQSNEEKNNNNNNNNRLDLSIFTSFGGQDLTHSFNFKSVYNHYDNKMNQEVTSCINNVNKIVDYIFYTSNDDLEQVVYSDNTIESKLERASCTNDTNNQLESAQLKLLARLKLFTIDDLNNVYLPNKNYSSDHFMLAAKFVLI